MSAIIPRKVCSPQVLKELGGDKLLFAILFKKDGTVEELHSADADDPSHQIDRDHLKNMGPLQIEKVQPAYFLWFRTEGRSETELDCCINFDGEHIARGPAIRAFLAQLPEEESRPYPGAQQQLPKHGEESH